MLFRAGLIVVVFVSILANCSAQCEIDIAKDLQGKDPVFITPKGELWVPSEPLAHWKKAEKGTIACGVKGSLTSGTLPETDIVCESKKTFKVGNIPTNVHDIQCTTSVTGDIEATKQRCSKTGTLHHIGFKTEKFGLVKYFDVCYDLSRASVVYTRHTIHGKLIEGTAKKNLRPTFKTAGVPNHAKPSISYKQAAQEQRLAKLLGSAAIAKKYIHSDSFLARGHLTPDADGIFTTWQLATYFYVNVAPEWQVVNAGNWLRVENLARRFAANLTDDVEVYTGIFGTLTLPNKNGDEVEISLEENDIISVPKWYWKILKYKNEGIAFVTLNNPFAMEKETLCPDICEKYGFDNDGFHDLNRGFTFCCSVKDLKKAIPDIPKSANVKKILHFRI